MHDAVPVTCARLHGALPERLAIDRVTVVTFSLDCDADPAVLASLLDDRERERAAALAIAADRRRFLVAHAITRLVLGHYLDLPPADVKFTVDAHGKPRLADARSDVRFNLSHAGDRALLALSIGRDVGIDIEKERPVEALNIARRYFAPAEYQALASLAPAEVVGAFFRCWTRKESFLKARGEGLAGRLDGFAVTLERTSCPLPFTARDIPPDQWTMISVPVEAGYAGALTAAGNEWELACCSVSLALR
jgi:4'-phosphopantetheinyl transferase